MPVANNNPIYINGAGIAGLTAALALARNEYRVVLSEKAEGFETVGAGLQLSPNAMGVLSDLGLAEKILAVGTQPTQIEIRKGKSNRHLASIPLGSGLKREFGQPYVVIHRADLQQILFAACQHDPDIDIRFSSEIVEMAPHKRGVTVSMREEGSILEHLGTAAIVADGVWSSLRTRVMKFPEPEYSGKVAWRAVFPADAAWGEELLKQVSVWFGPRSHTVLYPVRSGRQLNLVIITDGPETSDGDVLSIGSNELRQSFKRWKAPFLSLLDKQARWSGWPLFETPINDRMHIGGIGLVGDAAHGMLPFAAQGAAMAIEDAAILAKTMRARETAAEAMHSYSQARLARVTKVMKTARSNGNIYHLRFPSTLFRDLGMKILSGDVLAARQKWIYGWKAR